LNWSFAGPGEIVFGEGRVRELGERTAAFGDRAFVVTGRDEARAAPARDFLKAAGVEITTFPATGEPTFDLLRTAVDEARRFQGESRKAISVVVGVGGGSALDLAKGVGILLANSGDPLDYAEVIGAGKPLKNPSVPVIAVPTTAGTGSEATKNAVFKAPEHGVKVSLRSLSMFPRIALVDPELSLGLPPSPTAFTGMDALTQVLEPFVSAKANPATDALCASALAEILPALRNAFRDGSDREARGAMSRISLFGGLALGNAGLGAVHGIAGPLGGRMPIPHGAACAALLAPAVRVNLRALRERDPDGPGIARYTWAAGLVTGRATAGPEDLAYALEFLASDLGIPGLAAWGLVEADIPSLAKAALASSSMKGNPVPLAASEIEEIIRQAL
jgi:alcohol dehydrogenase class IV